MTYPKESITDLNSFDLYLLNKGLDKTLSSTSDATRYAWRRQDKAEALGLLDDAWTIHFLNIRFSSLEPLDEETRAYTYVFDSRDFEDAVRDAERLNDEFQRMADAELGRL